MTFYVPIIVLVKRGLFVSRVHLSLGQPLVSGEYFWDTDLGVGPIDIVANGDIEVVRRFRIERNSDPGVRLTNCQVRARARHDRRSG